MSRSYTEYYLDLLHRLFNACTDPLFYENYWLNDTYDELMLEVQEALGVDDDPRDE